MSSEEKTESTPKTRRYAMSFVVGLTAVILLLFVAWAVFEKMATQRPDEIVEVVEPTEPKVKEVPTLEEETESRTKTDFAKSVVTPRVSAQDSYTVGQGFTQPTTLVRDFLPNNPSPLEQEKERFKVMEKRRANDASRSSWKLGLPGKRQNQSPTKKRESPRRENKVSDHQLSTDEQRLMISKKLKEMEVLKARIKSGNFSPGQQTQTQSSLVQLQNSFSPPPKDVIGYTSENQYNASTEGKIILPIGTIIPGITVTKTSSDSMGTFKAFVSQDIFDVNYEYVLIPKGSEIILQSMQRNNPNQIINSRMGIGVPWIILPDGKKIDLSKSTGLDREGLAGISDQVDRHLLARFMGVAAYALIAKEASYQASDAVNGFRYEDEVVKGTLEQLGPIAKEYLTLKDTNTIRAGQSMNVITEEEIYLKPWRNIYEDYL
ncbi:putative conjugal transfer protein TrbI [Vibrio nigripulchritudo FTn2]|uniref:TrbI/VirB10 family protein n=1 Tax=Vibrio nigripulchritudo TaxID=28173 RepID=UPI0003B20AA3|nr:TrbI/VirB10 family protein [Vibrio nigripulchritudo]CCN39727.1 putative conjugal transfer protein TrbI [Vibrio nigripulchritudo FTn2]